MIKLQKALEVALPASFCQGGYSQKAITDMENFISKSLETEQTFLVHTCTAALEIAALALELKAGDEVILPSYTFVATGSAFLKRGCKLIFVDVDQNMNLDLDCVEAAITKNTKVVVPVHYGGLSCDMDRLMMLSQKYNFYVAEDAAQSIGAYYKNKALGTWGHLGCISFHHTKNIQTGEGGMLLVNNASLINKVQEIIDHGTNRQDFFKGKVSAYTWQRLGGAFRMDPLRASILKLQWTHMDEVTCKRRIIYEYYMDAFSRKIPQESYYNGHLFYIVLNSESDPINFVEIMANKDIEVLPHYQPLHESAMGIKYGCFVGKNINTIKAHRLYRLPLHHDISLDQAKYIVEEVKKLL